MYTSQLFIIGNKTMTLKEINLKTANILINNKKTYLINFIAINYKNKNI